MLLIDLREQAQRAVDDVRRIARELRPVAIEGHGLAGALADHLERLSSAELKVTLEITTPLPPLAAATEVAAYLIVTEAVTNTLRHAQAQVCTVCLGLVGSALEIIVADDGSGFSTDAPDGTGISSMAERATELGGAFEIVHGEGTTVTATLPVRAERT